MLAFALGCVKTMVLCDCSEPNALEVAYIIYIAIS